MIVALDQIYRIKIGDYPWTDAYAKANSTLDATLLMEKAARQLLNNQEIKITDLNPPQEPFHVGDRGLTCKWVKGILTTGSLKNGRVAVVESWLQPVSKSCVCDINTIMAQGCQCGGN